MAKYSPYHVFCDQVSSDTTLYDNFPNQFIWKSVDDLKTKGFVIDSVITRRVGSEGNPNVYHVIFHYILNKTYC
ncbi:MAG: hypothetical protein ACJ71H_03600 [Nitrososphaeraceae archaeon]